jgi:hypothetical protein
MDRLRLATDAYIYGYPLVYDVSEVIKQSANASIATAAPINSFGHAIRLGSPQDDFVSVNNDTLYSIANCDVRPEPLVLHVPDTNDRYYVLQFVDAWTNNFAYIGRRATGTAEGTYLLAGPGWKGTAPAGLTLLRTPTNIFSIVGRFAVNGAAEVPAVAALQAQTWLSPLSRYPDPPDNSSRHLGDWEVAPYDTRVGDDLVFWERLRSWIGQNPPPTAEADLVESFRPLGLLESDSPYVQPDSDLAEDLIAAANAGQIRIDQAAKTGSVRPVNGWSSAVHAFDYNIHYLGLGTIDEPEWRVENRPEAFLQRSASARGGLWGNNGYEAAYFVIYVDADGKQLNGANRYQLHFDQPPPVAAFWSVTMYDIPKYYLVENPINRYSIGDRTPGLAYNPDGSLDIYIQTDPPAADQRSNWLPSPPGDFRPLLRAYQPKAAILDGSYELPPIQRIE